MARQNCRGMRTPGPAVAVHADRRECDLYLPVKAFLEAQGYDVKGEIGGCDAFGTLGAGPPVVVELKLQFNLSLVLQGVDRLSLTDRVYLAVARPRRRGAAGAFVYRRGVRTLCRRLGLGLMTVEVSPPRVEVLVDPQPYRPRKKAGRLGRLLGLVGAATLVLLFLGITSCNVIVSELPQGNWTFNSDR